ncbi:MAG: hypothetical protein R6X02_22410 [Enhygromyxa sp.]
MSGPERLDVGSLLTIDVESELRKLTQAQLQGPWQLPAELVRQALRYGATRVEVELGRTHLRVRSLGGSIPYENLRELAVLLDPKRSPQRRHRALSQLERAGALSLLGLVGLEPNRLQIVSPGVGPGGEAMGVGWRSGEAVEIQDFGIPGPFCAELLVRGAKFDRARAREWLAEVARYAPIEIVVDGRPLVSAGFENAFSITRITAPVPATLALPREGDLARLYLLQDGLLTTHMSIAHAPCFEAAIETRSLAEANASAARLRELIQPLVPAIVDAAVQHMISVGRQGAAALAPGDRSRLTRMLLHHGPQGKSEQAKTIVLLPLFRSLERDGRERWCDLLALRHSIRDEGDERLLTALFPDQDPAEFAFDGRVFVLDESERALLGELLEVGFRQPRRRAEGRRGLARLLREGPGLLRNRSLFASLRPGGRPIPDATLTAEERSFLVQVRAQIEACEIAMCTGSGPVRRLGPGPDKLLLPRESARVRAAVVVVNRDPSWVYPALLALLEGRDFPERARRRWSLAKLG